MGRLIVRDVIGPEDKEQPVLLWVNHQDGKNYCTPNDDFVKKQEYVDMVQTKLKGHPTLMEKHLNELSTLGLIVL